MADGERSGGGGGSTAVVAIVGIIAILLVLYFLFGQGMMDGGTKKIDADVKIDTPAAPK